MIIGTVLAQTNWHDVSVDPQHGCVVDGAPTLKCIEVVFGNIVTFASTLIVLALFVMFVYGGYQYLTSLGNPEKLKKAQGTLKYAIIGFILYLSSFLILKIIDTLFLGGLGTLFKFQIVAPSPSP